MSVMQNDSLASGLAGQLTAFPWHEIDGASAVKRVCLFSDDELFRAGCEQVLASSADLDLRVSTGGLTQERATGFVSSVAPHAVIINVSKLTAATLTFLRELHEAREDMGIIVVYGFADQKVIADLRAVSTQVRSGFACVSRDSIASGQHLLQLVEAVADKRVLFDQRIMDQLLSAHGNGNSMADRLSHREFEVLELMATGLTNPGIADVLCLERKTIERHINSIYSKLAEASAEGHPRVNVILAYLRSAGRLDIAAA